MKKIRAILAATAFTACMFAPAEQALAIDISDTNIKPDDELTNIISPMSCPEVGQTTVSASVIQDNLAKGYGTVFRSGPGGVVKATSTETYTNEVSSSLSATVGVNQIVTATIQAGIANSVGKTTKTSVAYERTISNNQAYGNLQFVNWYARVNITQSKIVPPCNHTTTASGEATVPKDSWGYNYWED